MTIKIPHVTVRQLSCETIMVELEDNTDVKVVKYLAEYFFNKLKHFKYVGYIDVLHSADELCEEDRAVSMLLVSSSRIRISFPKKEGETLFVTFESDESFCPGRAYIIYALMDLTERGLLSYIGKKVINE